MDQAVEGPLYRYYNTTLEAQRAWIDIFSTLMLKEEALQDLNLDPTLLL